jgi:hypothetical protein
MFCIKRMTHPKNNNALPEVENMTSEDVTGAILQQQEGSAYEASSLSRNDSPANTGDSDCESQSGGSDDTTSESDLSGEGHRDFCCHWDNFQVWRF